MKGYSLICSMIIALSANCTYAGVGSAVPDITLPLVTNPSITVNLAKINSKYYLVDFWASWCASCKISMKSLSQLSKSLGPKGFKVVGISLDKDPQLAKQFLAKYPASFTQLHDQSGKSATQFGLTKMPTSYLVGPDKKIIGVYPGFNESSLDAIKKLVK